MTTPTQRVRAFLDGVKEAHDALPVASYVDIVSHTDTQLRRLTLGDLRAVVEHAEIVAKVDARIEEMRDDVLSISATEETCTGCAPSVEPGKP